MGFPVITRCVLSLLAKIYYNILIGFSSKTRKVVALFLCCFPQAEFISYTGPQPLWSTPGPVTAFAVARDAKGVRLSCNLLLVTALRIDIAVEVVVRTRLGERVRIQSI